MRAVAAIRDRLYEPADIASLVVFRIAFGAILLWEVWRYFEYGLIGSSYVYPDFHFTYAGFGWIAPWPGSGMYWHMGAMGLLAACIMTGAWYRVSAALFFVAFAYVFLLDQAQYLNHFYLVCLLSFLMIFAPAHRALSIDVLRRPPLRTDTVPAWPLLLLRAQVGIVYVYAALAKLNGDWLSGRPMNEWLADRSTDSILGPILRQAWAGIAFSYGGLLLDLLVVPLLLWRRTRLYAFAAAVLFHLLNARLFAIGIFPWMMIAATTLFLAPDWPRRVVPWPRSHDDGLHPAPIAPWRTKLTTLLIGVYLAIQLLVPLRHWLYRGSVHWTEEGHRFSWHMKLRDKESRAKFFATDPASGQTWPIDQELYLTDRQQEEMSGRPDMILQLAHHLADQLRRRGFGQIEIRAEVRVSLNGREPQLLIDPTVDLARQQRTLGHADWILPLERE